LLAKSLVREVEVLLLQRSASPCASELCSARLCSDRLDRSNRGVEERKKTTGNRLTK
jgi:hypothetical protein